MQHKISINDIGNISPRAVPETPEYISYPTTMPPKKIMKGRKKKHVGRTVSKIAKPKKISKHLMVTKRLSRAILKTTDDVNKKPPKVSPQAILYLRAIISDECKNIIDKTLKSRKKYNQTLTAHNVDIFTAADF